MLLAILMLAQDTTTTCAPQIGTVTCKTRTESTLPDYAGTMQRAQDSVPKYRAPDRSARLRHDVAALIEAKRCDDAKSLALRAGDLDMAEQVARICD